MKVRNLLIIAVIALLLPVCSSSAREHNGRHNGIGLSIILGGSGLSVGSGNYYSQSYGPSYGYYDCSYIRYNRFGDPILIQRMCRYNNNIIYSTPNYYRYREYNHHNHRH